MWGITRQYAWLTLTFQINTYTFGYSKSYVPHTMIRPLLCGWWLFFHSLRWRLYTVNGSQCIQLLQFFFLNHKHCSLCISWIKWDDWSNLFGIWPHNFSDFSLKRKYTRKIKHTHYQSITNSLYPINQILKSEPNSLMFLSHLLPMT